MIVNFLKYGILTLLVCVSHGLLAQLPNANRDLLSSEESEPESKHCIHAEFGGRTFLILSLNYEYALYERISIGGGFGLINLRSSEQLQYVNGVLEKGSGFSFGSSQMIYGNYFIGEKKNKLFFTLGLTHFLFIDNSKFPSGNTSTTDSQLNGNVGVGYQFSGQKVFFRLTGYCIGLPEPTGWFPKYMPWAGVSTGFKF